MNNRDDLLQGDSSSQDALQALAEARLEEKRDLSEEQLEEVAGGMAPPAKVISSYSKPDGSLRITTYRREAHTTVVHRIEDPAAPYHQDHPWFSVLIAFGHMMEKAITHMLIRVRGESVAQASLLNASTCREKPSLATTGHVTSQVI
jgi:hypothetical protein